MDDAPSAGFSSAKIDAQTYAEISVVAALEGRTIKDLVTDIWEAYKQARPEIATKVAVLQPAPRKQRGITKKARMP
jgi:hypothetical protein